MKIQRLFVLPRRGKRALRTLGIALMVLLGVAAVGYGGWQFWFHHRAMPPEMQADLFAGVHYRREVRRTPRPMVMQIVLIDLDTPDLRFRVTPGDARQELPLIARTTTGYLRETGAQLAINGDFFYPWRSNGPWDYYPHLGDRVTLEGNACSEGNCYVDDPARAVFPSLYLSRENHAFIGLATAAPATPYNVISGNVLLLQAGRLSVKPDPDLEPRTAVGIDRQGRTVIIVLIDGRQPGYSEGATVTELAEILRENGADSALNLDGGGSATLAVQRTPGNVDILNCPIDKHIPGHERPVANHLVVFAPPIAGRG